VNHAISFGATGFFNSLIVGHGWWAPTTHRKSPNRPTPNHRRALARLTTKPPTPTNEPDPLPQQQVDRW